MKTKHLVSGKWAFSEPTEPLKVGDIVEFTCNGKGRGEHYHVTAKVTGIKRKTFDATEYIRSYSPGTRWNLKLDTENLCVIRETVVTL